METYKKFYKRDDSNISVEHWQNSLSVEMHMHKYYELFFIEKGSCTHMYKSHKTLLIPGDSFLIRPHNAHGFTIHESASIFNCQFYSQRLDQNLLSIIDVADTDIASPSTALSQTYQANINNQGIVHLDPSEQLFFLSLLHNMEKEQEKQDEYYDLLKQKYLETILIIHKKRTNQQFKNYYSQQKQNQTMIMQTLSYIENNLKETINFNELAGKNGLSPNHFRKLFKDATGLAPVEYINRLRIIKTCDQLQNSDLSISEIAANVGIYDSNYFSRLFKQFMGCSPRHYVSGTKN